MSASNSSKNPNNSSNKQNIVMPYFGKVDYVEDIIRDLGNASINDFLRIDGNNSMLANLNVNGYRVIKAANAIDSTDVPNLAQVQSLVQSGDITTNEVLTNDSVVEGGSNVEEALTNHQQSINNNSNEILNINSELANKLNIVNPQDISGTLKVLANVRGSAITPGNESAFCVFFRNTGSQGSGTRGAGGKFQVNSFSGGGSRPLALQVGDKRLVCFKMDSDGFAFEINNWSGGNANNVVFVVAPFGTPTIDFKERRLINLGQPTNNNDAVTKSYVDNLSSSNISKGIAISSDYSGNTSDPSPIPAIPLNVIASQYPLNQSVFLRSATQPNYLRGDGVYVGDVRVSIKLNTFSGTGFLVFNVLISFVVVAVLIFHSENNTLIQSRTFPVNGPFNYQIEPDYGESDPNITYSIDVISFEYF